MKIFSSAEEMLQYICCGNDLFCPETSQYAFLYNDDDSICVYHLSTDMAEKLKKTTTGLWSDYLGFGGQIMSTEHAKNFCETAYTKTWVRTNIYKAGGVA